MAQDRDMYSKRRAARLVTDSALLVRSRGGFVAATLLVGLLVGNRPAWGRDRPAEVLLSTPATSAEKSPGQATFPSPNAPMQAFWSFAREMFARGDYVLAAEALEKAYEREPLPALLFNAGQAYRKASRYSAAIRAYERLLSVAPKHPAAAEARDHLSTLKILITQEERQKKIELAMEQTQEELDRLRRPPVYKRVWFWATVLGATATVVAIGVSVKVYQDQRTTDTGMLSLQF